MPASVFNQVTVAAPAGSVAPSTQIVVGNDPGTGALDVLVFNTSTTVTVYLSETNSSLSIDAGTPRVSPLGPQNSIVFDGTLDVFALVAPGQTAVLNLYPSATNFTPATQVTVLSAGGSIGGAPVATIPFGGSFTAMNMVDVSQFQSYDLNMALVDPLMQNFGHALCAQVFLSWYDDLTSGIPVFQEVWDPWVVESLNAGSPVQGIIGCGPMHGHFMSLRIVSWATAGSFALQYLNVFGSPRNVALSDWRQSTADQVLDNTYTLIPEPFNTTTGYDNSLADTSGFQTLAANTLYWMPIDLYAGPVTWSLLLGAGIVILDLNIVDVGSNQFQSFSGGLSDNVGNLIALPKGNNNGILTLPRTACALLVTVAGTGGLFAFKMVGQQGP